MPLSESEIKAWTGTKKDKECDHRGYLFIHGIVPYFSRVYVGNNKKVPVCEWGDSTTHIRNKARASKVRCNACQRYLTYEEARKLGITLYDIPEKFPRKKKGES